MPRPQITRAKPYTFHHGILAGRTFYSEHSYRKALAQTRAPRRLKGIRSASGYAKLRPAARVARERALDALSRMRRQKLSLFNAARASGTTAGNVLRHAGSVIKRTASGRYVVNKSDRLYRSLRVYTSKGVQIVEPPSSVGASLIGQHYSAMKHFVTSGDPRRINRFKGRHIDAKGKRYRFLTDLDEIERLGRAGEFSFESLYEHAA